MVLPGPCVFHIEVSLPGLADLARAPRASYVASNGTTSSPANFLFGVINLVPELLIWCASEEW